MVCKFKNPYKTEKNIEYFYNLIDAFILIHFNEKIRNTNKKLL